METALIRKLESHHFPSNEDWASRKKFLSSLSLGKRVLMKRIIVEHILDDEKPSASLEMLMITSDEFERLEALNIEPDWVYSFDWDMEFFEDDDHLLLELVGYPGDNVYGKMMYWDKSQPIENAIDVIVIHDAAVSSPFREFKEAYQAKYHPLEDLD
jgi:hypothetical protein